MLNETLLKEFEFWLLKSGLKDSTVSSHIGNVDSSRANIKASAASFKKFYTFLFQRGDISKEALKDLKALIKEEMPDWLDNVDDGGYYGDW